MKKSILVILTISLLLSGCTSGKITDFEEYRQELTVISNAAKSYYTNHGSKDEHLTLALDNYLTWADSSIEDAIVKVSNMEISYIWVSDQYVIFWNDETKTYGILHSVSADSVIKQLKSWYDGMEYHKLEKNWYEIGQFNAI